MARLLVPDELWARLEPLLPPHPRSPKGGRPPCSDRAALCGILLILRTGMPWEDLPQEIGCSGMTCWRRLRDWQQAGVWQQLWTVILEERGQKGRLKRDRDSLDASLAPAKRGVRRPHPTRPIEAKKAPNITSSPTRKASLSLSN